MSWFSKLFSGRSGSERVEQALARAREIMMSDAQQNAFLEASWQPRFGAAIDSWPNAEGAFGRDRRNPIPVNGPLGEILYISQLRTKDGAPFLGHLVRTVANSVDVYEIVSLDDRHWDLLYFDPFAPEKSRLTPDGLVRETDFGAHPFRFAVNIRVEDFPRGMPAALARSFAPLMIPFKPSLIKSALDAHPFQRPASAEPVPALLPVKSEALKREERALDFFANPLYYIALKGELHTFPPQEFNREFRRAWSFYAQHVDGLSKEPVNWLRSTLHQPVAEHLAFRWGRELFWVWLETEKGPEFDAWAEWLFLDAAASARAYPCIARLTRDGAAFSVEGAGYGLEDAVTGEPIDPKLLMMTAPRFVPVSDWELQQAGVQVVVDWLKSETGATLARQNYLGVEPAIWFERGNGLEYVVVRATKWPEDEAPRPENLQDIFDSCGAMSDRGHFASVSFAASDREDHERHLLFRNRPTFCKFDGLQPLFS